MNLREALAKEAYDDRALPGHGTVDAWIDAAAVLTHFEPLELKATMGTLSPLSPAMADLLDASTSHRASRHARSLRPEIRRQALIRLGSRAAIAAQLALNPAPDHPTQRAFQALLDDPPAVAALLRSPDPVDLSALAEAVGWLEGIIDGLPDPAEVEARLARARLLAPLRRLVGQHFAGREDVLADIAQHLKQAPDGAVLMLQGPGGVGKSTVLAKFILDAIETDPEPPTVMVLNLDDPQMVIDDPFTLLQEAGRQLRIQHPELNERLDQVRDYIASLQRRSRSVDVLESVSGGTVEWTAVNDIARDIVGLIPGSQPVLLVIDTFEEAQTTGSSAVQRLMQLVSSLRAGNPRLSVIIAGRVEEPMAANRTLTLSALDPVSARAVLEKAAGIGPLPDDVADRIFAVARGNPLATHLAGKILAAEGADAFRRDADLARLIGQIRTEKVQAQLYGRVLGHIRDAEVRQLAYPGLILRRITPDILRQVLAEPCGVTIADDNEAHRLFALFAAEVALAEPEPGTGALRYREDVRQAILDDLRADQPELAASIDQAAIAYYQTQAGAGARAEEIYHLLASGAPPDQIDQRWEHGVDPHLVRAVEELPPEAQVYLANRLRLDLPPDLQDAANQHQWEVSAEQTARAMLRDDLPAEALAVLNQRTTRLPCSPLYLTEAEALTILGQPAVALQVIGEGLVRAEAAGDRLMVVNLRLLETLILEGQRASPRTPEPARHAPAPPAPSPHPARQPGRTGSLVGIGLLLAIALALWQGGGDPADFAAVDEGGLVLARRETTFLPWLLVSALIVVGGSLLLLRRRRLRAPSTAAPPPYTAPAIQPQDLGPLRHAAAEAYRIALLTHNDLAHLRSIAAMLRLHRHAMPPDGPDPFALVTEAEAIIARIGLSALYDAPGLMRELAAELGLRNPQLLATALRVTGAYITVPPELRGDPGPGSAAAATTDPRARDILGDMALPESGLVDAIALISEAQEQGTRYALMALATDLLAAELDARRGGLPPPDIRQRALPWRQSNRPPDEIGWYQTTKTAFA